MKKSILALAMLLAYAGVSYASIVVTNGLTHSFDITPSGSQKGYIMLQNVGDEAQRVVVYKNELEVDCSPEGLSVKESSDHERSNSSWIDLGMEERILAPGEKYSMVYEVKAPDKPLAGSYWSLIMVEVKKPIDTAAVKSGMRVSSNIRYAIQIVTNLYTDVTTDVQFKAVDYVESAQGKALRVKLSNVGERLVNPKLKLEVYNENGEVVFTKTAESKKLYPKQCRDFDVLIEGVSSGKYQAVLIADCGESDLFGMTINLDVSE